MDFKALARRFDGLQGELVLANLGLPTRPSLNVPEILCYKKESHSEKIRREIQRIHLSLGLKKLKQQYGKEPVALIKALVKAFRANLINTINTILTLTLGEKEFIQNNPQQSQSYMSNSQQKEYERICHKLGSSAPTEEFGFNLGSGIYAIIDSSFGRIDLGYLKKLREDSYRINLRAAIRSLKKDNIDLRRYGIKKKDE